MLARLRSSLGVRIVEWLLFALFVPAWAASASAQTKTVCTVTVNSADEKEAFRSALPPGQYDFVELVEHGREDWLESSCRRGVRCDVLVISGHYDGGTEFFSDRAEAREYLPVDELERVSCNGACPGLFSQLKEVYLFGCNTLNPLPNASVSAEIGRSLQRDGYSRAEVDRMTRSLAVRHAQSSRDRMRLVFNDVPAIYGFSSVAPLGPTAATILRRHFQAGGAGDVGTGRASSRLLAHFSAHAMTVASGMSAGDPLLAHRSDVCSFADDRLAPERKAAFVHELLERGIVEARMFLDRLEKFAASLPPAGRRPQALTQSLDAIARDEAVRARYLELARDADTSATRARMIALAERLGWLTGDQTRDEKAAIFADRIARGDVSPAEVDLGCSMNRDGELDGVGLAPTRSTGVPRDALLACLGDAPARERVLQALTSSREDEVRFAQVVLSYRPLDQEDELPAVLSRIAAMPDAEARTRALQALAGQRLSDPDTLAELVRLYPDADSAGAQRAIAAILLRSDFGSIASADVVRTLQSARLRGGGGGEDVIDVLIRRMQAAIQEMERVACIESCGGAESPSRRFTDMTIGVAPFTAGRMRR